MNRQPAALKACINKASEWEIINKHPLVKVKPLKIDTKGKVRYLTDDEEIDYDLRWGIVKKESSRKE